MAADLGIGALRTYSRVDALERNTSSNGIVLPSMRPGKRPDGREASRAGLRSASIKRLDKLEGLD